MQKKKGIMLSQSFGAVLTLVLIAILVIVALYLFSVLGNSIGNISGQNNSYAYNATVTMNQQFATFPALIGLVGTIIFLSLVIGVLVASFAFGGKRGM